MGIFLQNKYVSHERRPVIKDQKHIQHINISLHLAIFHHKAYTRLRRGVRNKHQVLNMFPLVDFFRFFLWNTRLYIDTSNTKINSASICSRFWHKRPWLKGPVTWKWPAVLVTHINVVKVTFDLAAFTVIRGLFCVLLSKWTITETGDPGCFTASRVTC